MTTTQGSTVQSFPPEPVSARNARVFLRSFLHERSRDGLVDDAETALSEIVTNSVLHAHTDFQVAAVLLHDGSLRVEVSDSSPQLPAQRRYGLQATTGRGMQLVAAVTADCGVVGHGARGKTVWFVVRDPAAEAAGAVWDVAPVTPVPTDVGTRVLLLGLPPTLWLATRQHHDTVLRELALFAQEHPERAPSPERFAQADRARGIVATAVVAALERRAAGTQRRPAAGHEVLDGAQPPLDLPVDVPPDAAASYAAFGELLDVAEQLATDGALLASPGLPEVVAVRRWMCREVLAQCAGAPPSAWEGLSDDGAVAPPSEPQRCDRAEIEDVASAAHGAVVADATNRILAISRPLAQALGWAVDDLVGRRLIALVPPELREAHVAGFSRHVSTGEGRLLGLPLRLPVLRADGSRLLCDIVIERRPSATARPLYVATVEPVEEPT